MVKYIKKNKRKILIGMGAIIIAVIACVSYNENKKNIALQEFNIYLDSYRSETKNYILDENEEQYQKLLDTSQLALDEERVNEFSNLKSELEILKESINTDNLELINNNFNEFNNIDITILIEERKAIVNSIKGEIEILIKDKNYKEANEKINKLKEDINNEIAEINKAKEEEVKAVEVEESKKQEEEKIVIVNKEATQEAIKTPTGSYVSKLRVASETNQLIIVKGTGGSSATIEYHVKDGNGVWNEVFSTWGYVGQNGITYNKIEGDRKTPAGVYSFGTAFGVASNPGTSINYNRLTNNDYWVDDSNSKYYNKWVKGNIADKDWNSAEHMIEYSDAYKYGVVINYNTYNTIKGKGSAIFLHCTTQPTPGCVSIPESYLVKLLENISTSTRIVIAPNANDINNF